MLRRVPTIMQQEAVECGAACLAMVLGWHGRWITLEELRDLCGVDRDGTKASNIVRAARSLGMVAKGFKKEIDELPELPLPAILFWNFNHFVVLEAFTLGGKARINDPATGPRLVGRAEMDEAFTGVVLAFAPGDDFVRSGGRPRLLSLVRQRLSGYGGGLALAIAAGVLLAIPAIFTAGFSRLFIDGILIEREMGWLPPLLGAMAAIAVLRMLLTYLQQSALLRTQTAMALNVLARQMWTVLHLPLGFFAHRFAGDIANRFMLVDRLGMLITGSLIPAAISSVALLIYGAALLILDPVLAAIVFICSLLALLVLVLSARGIENASRRMFNDESKLQAITIQGIAMADDFRTSGTEAMFVARWAAHQAKVVDAEQSSTFQSTLLSNAAFLITSLGTVAVLVVGGFRVMDGVITIGVLLAFQLLMFNFTGPLLSFVGVGGQMQQVRGLAERLDDIMDYSDHAARQANNTPTRLEQAAAPKPQASLSLRAVSFGYSPLDAPFIADFDLEIEPGQRIALVGGSGSGKSTLGRLMTGLVQPRAGAIEIGGQPIQSWAPSSLRRTIAYVDQSIGLFEGKIDENISLWDSTMPQERMIAAAHDAGAHAFITALPGGYTARLTEDGGNLSGGERQRLAIARALAVDPAILVLDEATSALDPPVELAIMDAIRRRGCTTVIIAHRVSTIRDCDAILVMDKGRVVEMGTHGKLMAHGGHYRRLVEN